MNVSINPEGVSSCTPDLGCTVQVLNQIDGHVIGEQPSLDTRLA
jgi:hypothetical protein